MTIPLMMFVSVGFLFSEHLILTIPKILEDDGYIITSTPKRFGDTARRQVRETQCAYIR